MEENDYRMWHRFYRYYYIFYLTAFLHVVATVAADIATRSLFHWIIRLYIVQ